MSAIAVTLVILFLTPGPILLVYWGLGLWRIVRTRRELPALPDGLSPGGEGEAPARVCVLVPAHNEARVIEGLIAALRAQDCPGMSVLLCLDRCTDRTPELAHLAVAGDPRFRIFESRECPEGWVGKPYVLHRAVSDSPEARSADILLFLDADTLPAPQAVRAAVALLRRRGLDLLSLMTTLTYTRWFEFVVQPAASLELMVQYPLIRANRAENRRAFANGQFLMFRREAYDAIGGHGAVKDELLEDLAFARILALRDMPVGVYPSDGMVVCRMYGNWGAFRAGWKRIYLEAVRRKPSRLIRGGLRVRVFGALLPLCCVVGMTCALAAAAAAHPGLFQAACAAAAVLSALGLVAWALVMVCMAVLGRAPLWSAAMAPIGSWFVAGIMHEAAMDLREGRPVEWAGREYLRRARESSPRNENVLVEIRGTHLTAVSKAGEGT